MCIRDRSYRFTNYRTSNGTSHVTSELRFRRHVDSTDMGYFGLGDQYVSIGYGTAEKVRITSAGDVGIGTAIPVVASGYGNLSLANTTGGQLELKQVSTDIRHYIWGNQNLNFGGGYVNGSTSSIIFRVNGNTERLRINSSGDLFTQGLTSASFDNQGSNGRKYEFTGDGTAGKFPVINISGNSNTDGGVIGVLRFVNRENANSSSGGNNQSKGLVEFDCRSTTSDSNAGDDSGGYLRFITKDEEGQMSERFVLTAKGRFKSNGRENLGGIRERTSGVLANGESVSWNGSGTTYTNAALNWNSMGGNGGGWIGCLSVTAADGAPSGALVLVGIHGSGFNNYNMLQNSFDSGISVTPTGTGAGSNFWNSVISNTSGDTVYYRMLVYHLSTLASTVYGL